MWLREPTHAWSRMVRILYSIWLTECTYLSDVGAIQEDKRRHWSISYTLLYVQFPLPHTFLKPFYCFSSLLCCAANCHLSQTLFVVFVFLLI